VDNTTYGPCSGKCQSGVTTYYTPTAKFVYDGDGVRVLQVAISGTQVITTAYASALEVSITGTQRITKTYYSAGSQLIAMRQFTTPTNSVLYFLHSDHLGSTSLTTDQNGNALTRQLYDAWGNIRYVTGTMPTDIGFTGQRLDNSTGLMYYRARYYAQGLGRFISADTMVPDLKNPQQFNRYSYVLNSPLAHTDPTGHECVGILCPLPPELIQAIQALGVTVAAGGEVVLVGVGVGISAAFVAAIGTAAGAPALMWAMDDMGPDYSVPAPYVAGAVQSTYPLPGTNTVAMGKRSKEIFIPAFTTQDNTGRGKFSQPNPKNPLNLGAACSKSLLMLAICGGAAAKAVQKAYEGKTTEQLGGAQPLSLPTSTTPTSTPFAPWTPIPTRIPFLPLTPIATYTPISPMAPTSTPIHRRH
jgi:RHS repeat-associated protein